MSPIQLQTLLTWLMLCCLGSAAWAAPRVSLPLARPSNLFSIDEPVQLRVELAGFAVGEGEVGAKVTDYFKREVWAAELPARFASDGATTLSLEVGRLPAGYFEVEVVVQGPTTGRGTAEAACRASFGVAHFVDRSAEEGRRGGYRFGLKKWNYGVGIGGREWLEEEAVAASCRLGLQWTRELLQLKKHLGTVEMIRKYPMNVVMKVERFPRELYDEARYGPLPEWEAQFGKGAWTLKTLPQKEPYQRWLRQEIRNIPPEQNVFEIWNEAWDKMSPEDFATISQWIAEVILAERPDAIIGPNLLGSTSPYEFDARVIEAGGMKGMKMVALHPYGNSENRQWLRDYRAWVSEQVGHPIDLYVTEFGSHSTPEGPAKRSEREQAQRVVRQALALYAEDVKAFMPHWMGQSEQNPTYHEDWFGFFRFNHQPKPVLMAYANAARMIDASRYVGDLWFGPGMESMLFERRGDYTLVLVTRGEEKEIAIDAAADTVTVVDMVGAATTRRTEDGVLRLAIGPDVVYVVGVGSQLAQAATKELNPERWPEPIEPPRATRTARRLATPPTFDGRLDDWAGATELSMINPKVAGLDASGVGYLAWDEDYLYVGLDMRDNEMLNDQPRAKLYRQDSIELFVSTEPREKNRGFGPNDHQFFITPASGEGPPVVGEVVDREAGTVVDVEDAEYFVGKTDKGWAAEVAIPWAVFKGFDARAGARLTLDMRVNDADSSHERFKIDPEDAAMDVADPTTWSYLILSE